MFNHPRRSAAKAKAAPDTDKPGRGGRGRGRGRGRSMVAIEFNSLCVSRSSIMQEWGCHEAACSCKSEAKGRRASGGS